MSILFFSDVHGNFYALKEMLKWADEQKIEEIYFLGDVFGYYYEQNKVLEMLRKDSRIKCILGNHDQYFLELLDENREELQLINKYGNTYRNITKRIGKENIAFLKGLPTHRKIICEGRKIGIFHGSPSRHLEGRIYPDSEIEKHKTHEEYDYIILGHTHHKMEKKIKNMTILNPGSLGQPRDGKGCSALLLHPEKDEYEHIIFEFDRNKLVQDIIVKDGHNNKLIDVLYRSR